ncbi:hypothetical protein KIPB_001580 [Kipferlia bialata]|uniref:ABC transporter domain-containing protein n=1 Tax=Kipferlia bialata TaxID=797122 RepID=A0A9K3CR21_9EUKA|nr:hypothetical protein KIPB_001580 [Kipferlia bialata]|eukprot:g1580.t1
MEVHTTDKGFGLESPPKRSAWRNALILWKIGFPSWTCKNAVLAYLTVLVGIAGTVSTLVYYGLNALTSCALTDTCVDTVILGVTVSGDALNDMDVMMVVWTAVIALLMSALQSLNNFMAWLIGTYWRRDLTKKLQDGYLHPSRFYAVCRLSDIDNPDQRIGSDAKQYVGMMCGSNEPTLNGIVFGVTGMLTLIPTLVLYTIQSIQMVGPLLTTAPYLYLLILSGLMTWASSPLVRPSFEQEKLEGDFRYRHTLVRENAESIAFYGGDERERESSESLLMRIASNTGTLINRSMLPTVLQKLQLQIGQMLPYIVMATMFLSDASCMTFAQVNMFSQVLMALSCDASKLATYIPSLSVVTGIGERLVQMLEVTAPDAAEETMYTDPHSLGVSAYQQQEEDPNEPLYMDRCLIVTPDGLPLIRDVSFVCNPGQSLCIVGNSGSGKSSVLRALAGLWQIAEGRMHLPSSTFFVPQQSYLSMGTLRDQVMYPSDPSQSDMSDEALAEIIRAVDLGYLLDRFSLDTVQPWADMLSGGESQRLGFARLLFHAPQYAILDEATAALPVDLEARLMSLVKERGITCVSVAHRPTCIRCHEQILRVANGTASVMGLEGYNTLYPAPATPALVPVASHVYETPLDSKAQDDERDSAAAEPSFLKSFGAIFPFIVKSALSVDTLFLLLCIGCFCIIPYFDVYTMRLNGEVMGEISCPALDNGDTDTSAMVDTKVLWGQLAQSVFVLGSLCIVQMTAAVLSYWIGLRWRVRLTHHLQSKYFRDRNYYRLNNLKGIDNPDQRIAADIKLTLNTLCGSVVPTENGMLTSPGGLIQTVLEGVVMGATLLTFGYSQFITWPLIEFAVATVIQILATRPVKPVTFKQQEKEGDFRYRHSRIRTHYAESIAFYKGEAQELESCNAAFDAVYKNQLSLCKYSAVASFASSFIGNVSVTVFPLVIFVATGFVPSPSDFTEMLNDLVMVEDNLKALLGFAMQFAAFSGTLARVSQLMVTFTKLPPPRQEYIATEERVGVRGVDVQTPGKETLMRNLTWELSNKDKGIVVMGPSGVGKSSVLRTVAGLWTHGEGTIVRPVKIGEGGVFFVPQRPYLVPGGSLRSQISYPHTDEQVSGTPSSVYTRILQTCGLGYLVDRFGIEDPQPWTDVLSGGEQQRMGFARLLFHEPTFAIMDESTSALPVDLEGALLAECRKMGIALISVAHRPSVIEHHSQAIRVTKQGWELFDVKA